MLFISSLICSDECSESLFPQKLATGLPSAICRLRQRGCREEESFVQIFLMMPWKRKKISQGRFCSDHSDFSWLFLMFILLVFFFLPWIASGCKNKTIYNFNTIFVSMGLSCFPSSPSIPIPSLKSPKLKPYSGKS